MPAGRPVPSGEDPQPSRGWLRERGTLRRARRVDEGLPGTRSGDGRSGPPWGHSGSSVSPPCGGPEGAAGRAVLLAAGRGRSTVRIPAPSSRDRQPRGGGAGPAGPGSRERSGSGAGTAAGSRRRAGSPAGAARVGHLRGLPGVPGRPRPAGRRVVASSARGRPGCGGRGCPGATREPATPRWPGRCRPETAGGGGPWGNRSGRSRRGSSRA